MKSLIKKRFPFIFNLLKSAYQSTSIYQAKISKINKINEVNRNKTNSEELAIMSSVFNDQYTVQNGPFKGMKYIERSSGSALLPKILGSYEEPIQGWIKEIIDSNKYSNILDIGCAEGYYACGFAMTLPNTQITAYDIDPEARKNSNELKQANKLKNLDIKAECTHAELNERSKPSTLVFCDIEGFEDILLDPIKVPSLMDVDLLIESHDFIVPNITEILIRRFYMSHTMRILVDYPYRNKKYTTPNTHTTEQYNYIIDEQRPHFMKFIYMESICGKI